MQLQFDPLQLTYLWVKKQKNKKEKEKEKKSGFTNKYLYLEMFLFTYDIYCWNKQHIPLAANLGESKFNVL